MRTIEEIKKEIHEYQAKVKPFHQKLSLLDEELRQLQINDMERNVGRCFKYRNSYSCPESAEDYWFVYYQIVDVTSQIGKYEAISFERNIQNEFRAFIRESFFIISSRYIEISKEEFNQARKNYLDGLTKSLLKV